jgi:peptidoglycan/xylan/chitin deacetylase (PgdA/CDA1 family)
LLATAPAVSPVDVRPWYWTFTVDSLSRLLQDQFGQNAIEVEAYGNIFAASAFLYGLAVEELKASDLDVNDTKYALIIAARAIKLTEPKRSQSKGDRHNTEVGRFSAQAAQVKPLILMYHRIADDPVDYWSLAVSPARFEEQLRVLRRTRRPLPLVEFVSKLVDGTLPPDAVALTFDDGYVDNLIAGLPRLEAADVPATVFLATGFTDRSGPFWWDELANRILLEKSPKSFEIVIDGKPIHVDLPNDASAPADRATPAPLSGRRNILEAIYMPVRRVDEAARDAIMSQLRAVLPGLCDDEARVGRPMTSGEVRALIASGLVSIGAHTVTHPVMPELGTAACHREVAASKLACEALASAPVTAFAYPFGEYNAETCETVRTAGFAFACSTGRAPSVAASDIFALRRTFITNLDGDAFEQRIGSA